jgi:hypothetical protein
MLSDTDSRWEQLTERKWVCSGCGLRHAGLFDLVVDRPAACPRDVVAISNADLHPAATILSEDFCIVDASHYFTSCLLQLPLLGSGGQRFGFGVWASLSRENFVLYSDTFNTGTQGDLGPWFGYLSNHLAGYPETFALKTSVRPNHGRNRPFIELEPTDHPLAVEQRDGITFDRMMDIYRVNGHNMGARTRAPASPTAVE